MSIHSKPTDSLLCFLVIGLGIPVYLIFVVAEKPIWLDQKISKKISIFEKN